jgi:dolichol-phosphate mannosyltransferase
MSGFFAVRRDRLLELGRDAKGFKIGLEILARGGEGLRVLEVPIVFHDRIRGTSKIGPAVVGTYVAQLAALAGAAVSMGNALRFGMVGLTGFVVDLGLFNLLLYSGVPLGPAHLSSFFAAVVVNYVLNSRWVFTRAAGDRNAGPASRYLLFVAVAFLAVLLRGGVLAFSVRELGLAPSLAMLPAIVVAAVVNYLGCAFLVFAPGADPRREHLRWRVAALGVLGYVCALRLVYIGQIGLLREEAYYWNYSQHPALGYLDHPPMVAWLIWLGTHLFGHNEFGVRIGASVCWLITLVFSFLLARNLAGKTAAFQSAMLMGVLPFFFSVGVIMVPDAPLMACWSAALYFLERALLGERAAAWWGVGAALGLGMLSKYTIVLLGLALLGYLVLHPFSRWWLRRPEPYGAALLSVLLFMPVIVWNARHAWASFVFQGPGRLARTGGFALPVFLVSVIVLITPTGVAGAIRGMLRRPKRDDVPWAGPAEDSQSCLADRSRSFVLIFTLVPLLVFVLASLRMASKLNWSGPTWLAALPAMALTMMAGTAAAGKARGAFLARSWKATIVILLLFYGLALHYPVLGVPGVHLPPNDTTMNWPELGRQVGEIKMDVLRRTGQLPLVVGMQRYELSSELAFYDPGGDGAQDTASPHLFGRRGLMYEYWFPRRLQEGKDLLLVGTSRSQLDSRAVHEHTESLEPIHEIRVTADGSPAVKFYWRLAHAYRETPGAAPARE